MPHKFTKTVVFALAVLLAVVPFALAQGTTGSSPGGTQRPGMSSPGTTTGGSSQSGMSGHSGMSGMMHAIPATVTDVDQKDRTVKLRMQDGETVELKVPQTLASELNEGDSVQVTIRKADKGMGGATSPSSPGGSSPGGTTQPRPGQTR
jgi:hypothetical protein